MKLLKYLFAALPVLQTVSSFASVPENPWAAMARTDASYITNWIEKKSISAVYPTKDEFAVKLTNAKKVFDDEALKVASYTAYREALGHFVGSFQDSHLHLQFVLSPTVTKWPGFFGIYKGGRYITHAAKGSDILDGEEISSCDGTSMDDWVRKVATYEQLILDLESTKVKAAPSIFRDDGSTFIPRPKTCRIAGKDVSLKWSAIASSQFTEKVASSITIRDRVTAITPFGENGAWVRMGIFMPETPAEGRAFKKLIAGAPSMREKGIIVLDVRGNGGGPYEWFMGFLRGLYGDEYVNYYARARLQISNVYRATPEILDYFNGSDATKVGDLAPPADGILTDDGNVLLEKALREGKPVLVTAKNSRQIPMPKTPPSNPVKGKVYVLTDYNCASACIGFVDELKKMGGVEQIGFDTSVDSRTGTPFSSPLPSGSGQITVPVMTRDGRERGDNIPQHAARIFNGNIADTEALKAWVRSDIASELFKQ